MRYLLGALSFLLGLVPGLVVGLVIGFPGNTLLAADSARSAAVDVARLEQVGRGLVSHRAAYDVSLARTDARNYRTGVSGVLSLEFHNSCDGYALNQRFFIDTTTEDGQIQTDMLLGSFEARDGHSFRFRLREQVNGEDEEDLVGRAAMSPRDNGGRVIFTEPAGAELLLPPGAIFPTEHTIRLIAAAQDGQNWLQADVYDGSSAESYSEVGGFIGRATTREAGGSAEQVPAALKGQRSWRIRLAYFSTARKQDTPDYEIAFRLYENGISDDIIFDYGDYAIRATLRQLDMLPGEGC